MMSLVTDIFQGSSLFYPVYRLFEILVFILNWIFVHEVPVHSYRRSIAGFFLNVVELSLYVSVISLLGGCVPTPIGKYALIHEHLVGIFTLNLPKMKTYPGCQVLSSGEFFLSLLLILVVISSLVGAIARGEVGTDQEPDMEAGYEKEKKHPPEKEEHL